MPDYTGYGGPRPDPTADPNGVPFAALDSLGRHGSPGRVFATLAPGRTLSFSDGNWLFGLVGATPTADLGNANAPFSANPAQTVWLLMSDAVVFRRDGYVTF